MPAPGETVTVTTPSEATREEADRTGALAKNTDVPQEDDVPRGEPREHVRLGALTITGPRSVELVQGSVRAEMLHARTCHEAATKAGRTPTGVLRIRLVVTSAGRVKNALRVTPSSVEDAELTQCVLKVFARAKFPAAVGADSEVIYPVYFTR